MTRRVFLDGAGGFVGKAVLDRLIEKHWTIRALSRGKLHRDSPQVLPFRGTLDDGLVLDAAIGGVSAVVHLVGIIMERSRDGVTFQHVHVDGTRAVVEACKKAGVRRYIHMSALGTRADAASEYHRTKWQAEQIVRGSGLDFTIFRPSMIHGPGGFMTIEAMWARKKAPPPLFVQPFMPYFASNPAGTIQPILVDDVARAFVEALDKPETIGTTIDLGGPEVMTWQQMHQTASKCIVGRRRMTAPIPARVGRLLAGVGLGPMLGFNRDQVIMATEQNTCDLSAFQSTFGWTPVSFEASLSKYADQL